MGCRNSKADTKEQTAPVAPSPTQDQPHACSVQNGETALPKEIFVSQETQPLSPLSDDVSTPIANDECIPVAIDECALVAIAESSPSAEEPRDVASRVVAREQRATWQRRSWIADQVVPNAVNTALAPLMESIRDDSIPSSPMQTAVDPQGLLNNLQSVLASAFSVSVKFTFPSPLRLPPLSADFRDLKVPLPWSIGTSDECTIVVNASTDFSSQHCTIGFVPAVDAVCLTDTGSAFGTAVKLTSPTRLYLAKGARIRLGHTDLYLLPLATDSNGVSTAMDAVALSVRCIKGDAKLSRDIIHSAGACTLGRDPSKECPQFIGLAGDPYISRQHARIYYQSDAWWLEDVSANKGVYIYLQTNAPYALGTNSTTHFQVSDTYFSVKVALSQKKTRH